MSNSVVGSGESGVMSGVDPGFFEGGVTVHCCNLASTHTCVD